MSVHNRTKCRPAITVASALALPLLFGCNADPNGVEDDLFVFQVNGLVLEYADGTKTATRPVVDGTWLGLILPNEETWWWCNSVDCYTTNFLTHVHTFTDAADNSAGHYLIIIEDPEVCALGLQAWEEGVPGNGVYIFSGKTATAPRLAEPAVCTHGNEVDGPTLIIE